MFHVASIWTWTNLQSTGVGILLASHATVQGSGSISGGTPPSGDRKQFIALDPPPIWHRR